MPLGKRWGINQSLYLSHMLPPTPPPLPTNHPQPALPYMEEQVQHVGVRLLWCNLKAAILGIMNY